MIYIPADFWIRAERGGISSKEVKNAFLDVKSAVSKWKAIAKNTALSEKRINEIWEIIKI